jgi:hypothetical protein
VKVGGGLNYVVGPMGAGKSLYGVRRLVAAVVSGRHAVTNIELLPGWADRVASHVARFASSAKRDRIATGLESRYHLELELRTAMDFRLLCGKCGRRPYECGHRQDEARAVFVWDEGHNDLNNRTYKEREQSLLEWATQLRKLGFVGYLLSQSHENTDAQLRRICNNIIRLQNQREQTRMLGMRITPWPLFIAAWYPAHLALGQGAKGSATIKPISVERYLLDWHRNLYDTHGLYHGLAAADEGRELRWLGEGPSRAVGARAPGAGHLELEDPARP